ncbi:MAG: MFS transporter [Propionibacteriales bacterium]|nr:MFS transporter [Propionibacteriales bacterium]
MTEHPEAVGCGHLGATPHPAYVWGTSIVVLGVLLHLPMYVASRDVQFHMRGMAMDPWMQVGMIAIAIGLVLSYAGIALPTRRTELLAGAGSPSPTATVRSAARPQVDTEAPSDRLRPAHRRLVAALIFAVAIDTQKPFTFTFIVPDAAAEYGLSTPAAPVPGALPVALLPLSGIVGTAIGSFIWGFLGDRIGRRSALLFAAVLFVATSVCGAMPSFTWNVVMCFVMGLGAGGMLPAAYALLSETMPTRHRGKLLVLVGGMGTALGFVAAALAAAWVMPVFGWRIMWLIGAPTGLALLYASRFIPESPRFLLARGRSAEAGDVLNTFGSPLPMLGGLDGSTGDRRTSVVSLFSRPYTYITAGLVICSAAWGVVTFGFLVWLPDNVAALGVGTEQINDVLARSALIALPAAVVVAWLYARWSSYRTMVSAALLTALVLTVFGLTGPAVAQTATALLVLVLVLLVGTWAVAAVVTPYSAEVYPTDVRTRGAAITAGAGKLGGVVALTMAATGITPPGLAASATLAAIPMLVGAALLLAFAVETRAQPLEMVTATLDRERRP